jgi:HK97 gp10 family phage protein
MALIPAGSQRLVVAGSYSNPGTRETRYALEVNSRRLDKLDVEVRLRIRAAVRKVTGDVLAEAQQIIRDKNIIDTGNLLNSIMATLSPDGLTGYIDVGAYYGIYIEFGTRYQGARPFLGPAVETIGPAFIAAVRQAVREAAEAP